MNFLKCLITCFSFDTKNKIKSIAAKRTHAKKRESSSAYANKTQARKDKPNENRMLANITYQ